MQPNDLVQSCRVQIDTFDLYSESEGEKKINVIEKALTCFKTLEVSHENKQSLEGLFYSLKLVDYQKIPQGQELKSRVDSVLSAWKQRVALSSSDLSGDARVEFLKDVLTLVTVNIFPLIKANKVTTEDLKGIMNRLFKGMKNLPKIEMSEKQKKEFEALREKDVLRGYIENFTSQNVPKDTELEKAAILILQGVLSIANAKILSSPENGEGIFRELIRDTMHNLDDDNFKPEPENVLELWKKLVDVPEGDLPKTYLKLGKISALQRRVSEFLNSQTAQDVEELIIKLEDDYKNVALRRDNLKQDQIKINRLPRNQSGPAKAKLALDKKQLANFEKAVDETYAKVISVKHRLSEDSAAAFLEAFKEIFKAKEEESLKITPAPEKNSENNHPKKSSKAEKPFRPKEEVVPAQAQAKAKSIGASKPAVKAKEIPISKEEKLEQAFLTAPKNIAVDSRVMNWSKKDLPSLRLAARTSHATPIHGRSDEDLLQARMRHHLPGTEKVIVSESLESKYCYQTPSGWNIFSAVEEPSGRVTYGVLEHGIDTLTNPPKLYHRFFRPISELNTRDAYFRSDTQFMDQEAGSPIKWQPVGTTVKADAHETLRLAFEGEDYVLHLFTLEYFHEINSPSSRGLPEINRR